MNLDKETIKKIRGLIVFTAIILIGLWNYEVVLDGLGFIGRVIFPFVLGGAIAFVLNVPMHFIEEKFFGSKKMKKNKWANKFARPASFLQFYCTPMQQFRSLYIPSLNIHFHHICALR